MKLKFLLPVAMAAGLIVGGASPALADTTPTSTTTWCKAADLGVSKVTGPGQASAKIVSTADPSLTECWLTLETYPLPATYDGKGFDASAAPQFLFASTEVVVTRERQTFNVEVKDPGCNQTDLTRTTPQGKVTYPQGSDKIVDGQIFGSGCTPPPSLTNATPVAPTVHQSVCHNGVKSKPTVTLASTKGISYKIVVHHSPLPGVGTQTFVVATADKGYTIAPTTGWTGLGDSATYLVVFKLVTCVPAVTHSPPPPSSQGTPPPATPAASSTPATLAFTGAFGIVQYTLGGIAAVALGILAMVWGSARARARRRMGKHAVVDGGLTDLAV